MTLKSIEIKNVKGIDNKRFDLDILPNRPSILVAPNGFGKSSLTCAFNSMNNARIVLKDENFYKGDVNNHPEINIRYQKQDNTIIDLSATENSNTIKNEFDYFVIKSPIKAKGSASFYGGAPTAKIIIESIVLVDNIPPIFRFNNYTIMELKQKFGINGKILPNPNIVFNNKLLVEKISENYLSFDRANGVLVTNRIQDLIDEINALNLTKVQIIQWIEEEKIEELRAINHLNSIAELIQGFDLGEDLESHSFLLALQIIWIYHKDINLFKQACSYSNYKMLKDEFDSNLSHFDTTWKNIKTAQRGQQLIIEFPKASEISNGQRDILTFMAMLFKAKRKLRKNASILIIDEVFDYLDEANLLAAQYYVTKFIKDYKNQEKRIYPLILTHLNPLYFKNYAFKKQKTYYLDKTPMIVNQSMRKLVENRDTVEIKDTVSSKLFHFNPESPNKRMEFRNLGIRELWGIDNNFYLYIYQEVQNYLNNNNYDPFAVCCGIRVKIEEITYNKIEDDGNKILFIQKKMTRPKLEFAESIGIRSPEVYYLLGIVYNDGMHWKNNTDNISPIVSKLENLTIKKIISEIF